MCKLVEDYAKEYAKLYGEQEREIGKNQGLSTAIINMLKKKLGSLTPDIMLKIETSSTDKLEQLSFEVIDIKNENDIERILVH